jgi:hypothetical protein
MRYHLQYLCIRKCFKIFYSCALRAFGCAGLCVGATAALSATKAMQSSPVAECNMLCATNEEVRHIPHGFSALFWMLMLSSPLSQVQPHDIALAHGSMLDVEVCKVRLLCILALFHPVYRQPSICWSFICTCADHHDQEGCGTPRCSSNPFFNHERVIACHRPSLVMDLTACHRLMHLDALAAVCLARP